MPGPGDLLTFWKGKLIGVVPAGASTARITIPHTSKNAGQDHSMLVLIDDAHPFPRWGAERSDPPGKRKRADIAWMDVVAHSAEGSRAFTISPRGHAR
jgi:hypothetical protein